MGLSVKKGVYISKSDFLIKCRCFLKSNGWTVYKNSAGGDEFIATSNATGQLTTKDITPGAESINIAFTSHSVDGLNQVKMQRIFFFDIVGPFADFSTITGDFPAGTLTPVDLGAVFNDISVGSYLINTDGSPAEGGSWVGIHTTSSEGDGRFSFQGAWTMAVGVDRQVNSISDIVADDIEFVDPISEQWKPETYALTNKPLELADYTTPSLQKSSATSTISTTPPILKVNANPTNAPTVASDWYVPRALLNCDSVEASDCHYFIPGELSSPTQCVQGVMSIKGSDPVEGDPSSAYGAFEASVVTIHDPTNNRGIVLHVNPACAVAVPKGNLVADIDKIKPTSADNSGRVTYDVRQSSPSDEFFWAVRTR